jgi:hypothetical protein
MTEKNKKLQNLENRRHLAIKLNLEMPEYYIEAPIEDLDPICNGIGNESMFKVFVRILNFLFRLFRVCADIHDVRFEFSDGTKKSWKFANREMKHNNKTMAKYYFPLVFGKYFRNIYWRTMAKLMFIGVMTHYGFKSWQEAHDKTKQKYNNKD